MPLTVKRPNLWAFKSSGFPMRSTLNQAIKLILKHEGGYVNHPKDPGGETNYGITKATAQAHGYFGDMKSLPLEIATSIYRDTYWQRISGDELPSGLDVHVFDMAVNAGPGTAVRLLQRLVGVADDGIVGPVTLKAVATHVNIDTLIKQYTQARLDYYKKLSRWPDFGKGWSNRNDATTAVALELAKAAQQSELTVQKVLVVRVDGKEVLRIIPAEAVSVMWEQV